MNSEAGARGIPKGALRALFNIEVNCVELPKCVAAVFAVTLLLVSSSLRGQLIAPMQLNAPPVVSGIEKPLLWVVPSTLIVGGVICVNEFGLTGANLQRHESYYGRRQKRVRADDYLQHVPMLMGVLLDVSGVKCRRESLVESFSVKMMGGVAVAAIVLSIKSLQLEQRPDGDSRNSFVSGHTATAFLGAELLRLDYGRDYPWVAAAGYGMAVATAMFRVWHARHWTSDVVAGAGVGIAAAWIGHYTGTLLSDWIMNRAYTKPQVPQWHY